MERMHQFMPFDTQTHLSTGDNQQQVESIFADTRLKEDIIEQVEMSMRTHGGFPATT